MKKYTVRMRDDLAKSGHSVPAGKSYQDYDDLQEVVWLTAKELANAEEYDNGEDPDAHPFQVVKLKDGRILYLISADLDYNYYSEEQT
jgi:hypothetical protein